jgi:aryl-alcohol dehydrogenase-like predicted oxidoreductase
MVSGDADELLGGRVDVTALSRRTLGRSRIAVPALGIGCWAIGGPDHNLGLPMGWSTATDAASVAGLERAYALGVRLFDTADVYGHGHSERLLGRLVAEVGRDELVLVSKVGYFTGTAAHGYDPRHMRRQLAQSLDNLGTDHVDIYVLHHNSFGPNDQYLEAAAAAVREFRAEGLIRAVGMRGPHRYALDRLAIAPYERADKVARFHELFDVIRPDVLAVRDNLLTPADRSAGVFAFAEAREVGVLINKPLGQGLLTGAYPRGRQRMFGDGDHRSRKRWFTDPAALAAIADGLDELRTLLAGDPTRPWPDEPVGPRDFIRVALWSCLSRSPHAAVLVGFTHPDQVLMNLICLGATPPADDILTTARAVMGQVQRRLDTTGRVFVDEPAADGVVNR